MFSTKQKNGFFNAIQEIGLSPMDFTIDGGDVLTVTHLPTKFLYKVSHLTSGGRSFVNGEYTPDNSGLISVPNRFKSAGAAETWERAYFSFTKWLKYIQEEEETPTSGPKQPKPLNYLPPQLPPDEKFTDHELRELQSQLRTVEQKLTASSLPETAIQELTAALRDAAPKAEGMSKKDWQNMVIGAVVGTVTNLALSTEHVNTVYQILKVAFTGWLLH